MSEYSNQIDIGDIGGDNLMTWKQGHKLVSVPTNQPSQNQSSNQASSKCGVICQKKKKRKVLFIGLGVLLVGGLSYFILKKK